jgi:hypothetical protein
MPQAFRQFHNLQLHETVRASELLEIPTVMTSTDLLDVMPASLGPLMEKRLGLRVLAIPLELREVPILHDLASDAKERQRASMTARDHSGGGAPPGQHVDCVSQAALLSVRVEVSLPPA